jgi:hypothetical protein
MSMQKADRKIKEASLSTPFPPVKAALMAEKPSKKQELPQATGNYTLDRRFSVN